MFSPSGEKTGKTPEWKKSSELQREEASLKSIIDRNYQKSTSSVKKDRPDLVDNFHWVIMRVRRTRKLTQEQFANEISEPLIAVKLAEEGILPDNDYALAKKIENFLGITIIKKEMPLVEKPKETPVQQEQTPERKLTFDSNTTKGLTIADLRRMRQERQDSKSYSEFAADNIPDVELEEEKKEE